MRIAVSAGCGRGCSCVEELTEVLEVRLLSGIIVWKIFLFKALDVGLAV